MIETPHPLDAALVAAHQVTRHDEHSDEIAASLAALNLGCAQLLQPANELVLQDFRDEEEIHWPQLQHAWESPITETELRSADEFAGFVSEAMRGAPDAPFDRLQSLRKALYDGGPDEARRAALALPLASMAHPHPLVQVSAAVAALSFVTNPVRIGQAINIVMRPEIADAGLVVQQIALTGLTRFLTDRAGFAAANLKRRLGRWLGRWGAPTTPLVAAADAVLVHGTIFNWHGQPLEEWWRPTTGDLHAYLKRGALPGLYAGSDYFRWSGGWNDYAREEAADKLVEWLKARAIHTPDVIAHSHGGNVSMLASHQVGFNKLILLSCPVHWPAYQPGKTRDVLSIRIKWDLVIMADGAAQRFPRQMGIREKVLPLWFTAHDASRRSQTWAAQRLEQLL